MENVTFLDLAVQPGAMYLYVHQGDCEHGIVFGDIRMAHQHDVQNRNSYPVVLFQAKIRRRKCRLCDIYPAKWVTYCDKFSAENPTFWCERCYHSFHYGSDGQLLYSDFRVFPYLHEP